MSDAALYVCLYGYKLNQVKIVILKENLIMKRVEMYETVIYIIIFLYIRQEVDRWLG